MCIRFLYLFLLTVVCNNADAQRAHPERIFAQTDRSLYLSGESLFFSILVLEGEAHTAAQKSRVVQVELINDQKKSLLQKLVLLEEGRGAGSFSIPDSITSGSYELRIYSSWMKNWGEQSFYSQSIWVLNPYDTSYFGQHTGRWTENPSSIPVADIQLDKAHYSKRSLVAGSLPVDEENPFIALTVSVLPLEEVVVPVNPISAQQQPIQSEQVVYLPEWEGPLFQARIMDAVTGQPIENQLVTLVQPGTSFVLNVGKTNRQGISWFNPGPALQKGDLIIQQVDAVNNRRTATIEMLPVFAPAEKIQVSPFPELTKAQQELFRQRFVQLQLQELLFPKESDSTLEKDSFQLGSPDTRYQLDQYTRFKTMQEIFREYISEVRVRSQDSSFQIRIRNKWIPGFFETDPLILIDGIPVWDPAILMEMDPQEVKSIDVYTQRIRIGNLVKEGVLVCRTYAGTGGRSAISKDAIILSFPGIQQEQLFIVPDYSTQQTGMQQLPDRRSLLYWNPALEKSKTGSFIPFQFFTSDQAGSYTVLIRGIDKRYRSFERVAVFEVK